MSHFSDGVRVGANFANNGTASQPGAQTSPIFVYDIVPDALVANGIATAQAVAGAGNLTLNGSLVSGGVATFDVPRAVSVTSANAGDTTQTATVYGTDAYGIPVVETISFNGAATVSGKKAFKTVTRIAISAAMAGNTSAGTTDILGLPYAVNSRNYAMTAYNGAIVTTGTFVAAVTTSPATATTGDVRGTYTPASATDASKRLTIWIYVSNPDSQTGLYGVSQYS